MGETAILWLFGIVISVLTMGGGGMLKFCFSINTRMTAMETYIKSSIKGAAEVLHNDDTPRLDALLEKLVESYHDHHYDLSDQEWKDLETLSRQLKEDVTREPGKRLSANIVLSLAKMVNDLSIHKMARNLKP